MSVVLGVIFMSIFVWGLNILIRRLIWMYRVHRGLADSEPTIRAVTPSWRRNVVLGVIFAVSMVVVLHFATASEDAMSRYGQSPEVSATLDVMIEVNREVDAYIRATGTSPPDLAVLVAEQRLTRAYVHDAWGSPLSYQVSGERYTVCSAGADLEHGTGDDICTTYLAPSRRPLPPDRPLPGELELLGASAG